MLFRAEWIAGDHLRVEDVLLPLDHRVVRPEVARLRHDVRRHAGTDDADPVLRAVTRRARRPARERDVVRGPEGVTERAARLAEDDRGLPLPSRAVGGVERVDVEAA